MHSQQAQLKQGVIFWFRSDLRLHDQPALQQAISLAQNLQTWMLPVYIHDSQLLTSTRWGFHRTGPHRRKWLNMALRDLAGQLEGLGSRLLQIEGPPSELLTKLSRRLGNALIICEEIAAPEESSHQLRIERSGVSVQTVWQSTLMSPDILPFPAESVPDQFTLFRQALERAGIRPSPPLTSPSQLPPPPSEAVLSQGLVDIPVSTPFVETHPRPMDQRSAFPWTQTDFHGGERAALAHLEQYCRRGLPHSYKTTRNQLVGIDYSTKWSPWLATGALSPRQAWSSIQTFEAKHGANDSTYWICFELLWRDHFRWLHRKHGVHLYRPQGLTDRPAPAHDAEAFQAWCAGQTGQAFIDCGMRELAATGYLSNRLRQNVASYLIHDLQCDWRAGAAWFEAQLIDYDVYSNQGNWLYLSGRGTDPRGSRRFNPVKQANDYDPEHRYRQLWA